MLKKKDTELIAEPVSKENSRITFSFTVKGAFDWNEEFIKNSDSHDERGYLSRHQFSSDDFKKALKNFVIDEGECNYDFAQYVLSHSSNFEINVSDEILEKYNKFIANKKLESEKAVKAAVAAKEKELENLKKRLR